MMFASSHIAVWLWMVPAIALFFLLCARSRERAMRTFAREGTLKEIAGSFAPRKKKARDIITLAAFLFMILALMRPQWGFEWREIKRQGIDIMIALDTSNSMLAEDVRPNRLKRAKLAVKDLVRKLRGDRVGLITFAGTAFLQCPLTMDYNGFLMALDDVDTYTIPIGGTSLTSAIYKAIESFESEIESEKILILITDGEDHEGGLERAIQYAKARDLRIFSVGVGSSEGALIPIPGERGKEGFLRDAEGNVVRSRLNELPLQQMAIETGGMYVRAAGAGFGLDLIYEQELSKLQRREIGSRMEKNYHERFQIPLAMALLFLFIEPLIGDRKKNKVNVTAAVRNKISKSKRDSRGRKDRKVITLLSLLIMNLYCANVLAAGGASAGERLLREEKYDEALEKYEKALEKRPHDPVLEYNRAIILYHKGDMARSSEAFMRAGALGENEVERKAAYNVGNTKYRMGEFLVSKSPEMSIKGYNEALEYYMKAMELDPDDMDAKYNYEFTLSRMQEAESEQEEQDEQDEQEEQEEQEEQDEQDEQDDQNEQDDQDDQDEKDDKDDRDEKKDPDDKEGEDDKEDPDDRDDQDQREDEDQREEPREPEPGPMYEEPVAPDLKPADEDPAPGEMTEEQAMMLLNWQGEEENRMRSEMREDQRDERPPVVIDW